MLVCKSDEEGEVGDQLEQASFGEFVFVQEADFATLNDERVLAEVKDGLVSLQHVESELSSRNKRAPHRCIAIHYLQASLRLCPKPQEIVSYAFEGRGEGRAHLHDGKATAEEQVVAELDVGRVHTTENLGCSDTASDTCKATVE